MNENLTGIRAAWHGVLHDQRVLQSVGGDSYRPRNRVVALFADPGLRAALLMRLATMSRSKLARIVARNALLTFFGCDIGASARIEGGLYLPHPTGIVIGANVRIADGVQIFQGVTLGASKGGYPRIGEDVAIFPNSVVVGGITVGTRARIGAGSFVDIDVLPATTIHARRAGD